MTQITVNLDPILNIKLSDIQALQLTIQTLEKQKLDLTEKTEIYRKERDDLAIKLLNTEKEFNTLIRSKYEVEIEQLRAALKDRDTKIELLEKKLNEKEEQIKKLQTQIGRLNSDSEEKNKKIQELDERVKQIEGDISSMLKRKLCHSFEKIVIQDYFRNGPIPEEYQTLKYFAKDKKEEHMSHLKKWGIGSKELKIISSVCSTGNTAVHKISKSDFEPLSGIISQSYNKDFFNKMLKVVQKELFGLEANSNNSISTKSIDNNNNSNNNNHSNNNNNNANNITLDKKSTFNGKEKVETGSNVTPIDENKGFIFKKKKEKKN